MKISKSKAKELYLLNDNDLEDLDVTFKNNYMNSNNPIKLYDQDDLIECAIEKYGTVCQINEIKRKKNNDKDKKLQDKIDRQKKLINYFTERGYFNEDDIISEYPCYLYIEFNKSKFNKEVNNKISYDIDSVYQIAINRINRRNQLINILRQKNIEYRPESVILNEYINKETNLSTTIQKLEENSFYWKKTIYGKLRKNFFTDLNKKGKNDLKEDVLYYHLLTSQDVSFPETLKESVEKILKTFIFFKDKNIGDNIVSESTDLYQKFINTIKIRNKIILTYRNSNNLPEFIKNKLNNYSQNNINISYE